MKTKHEEVEILSDDVVPDLPTANSLSSRNRTCQNPQAPSQVNKSANKSKRRLTIWDSTIADAIKYCFDEV
jgi:hypothetical protein